MKVTSFTTYDDSAVNPEWAVMLCPSSVRKPTARRLPRTRAAAEVRDGSTGALLRLREQVACRAYAPLQCGAFIRT